MGRKQHLPLGRPRFLVGIAIHVMQAGQVFHVHILPRDRARRDGKIAGLAHSHAPDIRAPLGAGRDDRFGHVPGAKAPYGTRPFALRARKPKRIHQTHLTTLADRRGDEQGRDASNDKVLRRGGTNACCIKPMGLR